MTNPELPYSTPFKVTISPWRKQSCPLFPAGLDVQPERSITCDDKQRAEWVEMGSPDGHVVHLLPVSGTDDTHCVHRFDGSVN
jgi:hypothetical protein